jgi:Recombination endonuclease VII
MDKHYRDKNIESVRRSARRYKRKEGVRSRLAEAHLLQRYGLTREAFEAKLEAQGGECPLCLPDAPEPMSWDVDHDHACCPGPNTCGGCLRDILCHGHNMALGHWDDDPAALRAAADYIERWRAKIQAAGTTPWQPKGVPSGPDHYAWKGDEASRKAMRLRAYRVLGSADRCVNDCSGAGRYEWVLAKDGNPADPAAYIPMCRRCSTAYSGNMGAGHPTAKLTAEQAAEIRARYMPGRAPTQPDLAREYGVSQATISLILRGERYAQ